MPAGADGSDAEEQTRRGQTSILASPNPQAFVRHRASFSWDTAAAPGIILNAPEIAVLAAAQCTHLTVTDVPACNLSTGDELVKPTNRCSPVSVTLISMPSL